MMKLSEAIREGAKKRPMITGSYFEYDNYECQGSCALGAAYEALVGEPVAQYQLLNDEQVLNTIGTYVGVDMYQDFSSSFLKDDFLWRVIADLNDERDWTREQIADWLASKGL